MGNADFEKGYFEKKDWFHLLKSGTLKSILQ